MLFMVLGIAASARARVDAVVGAAALA